MSGIFSKILIAIALLLALVGVGKIAYQTKLISINTEKPIVDIIN